MAHAAKANSSNVFDAAQEASVACRLAAKLSSVFLAIALALTFMPAAAFAAAEDEADAVSIADIAGEGAQPEAVENELVVVYEGEVADIGELNEGTSQDVEVIEKETIEATTPEGDSVDVVTVSDETDIDAAIEELTSNPKVAFVEPNYIFTKMEAPDATITSEESAAVPLATSANDPELGSQYYLTSSGFRNAWDRVKCDNKVTVVVIDDGCMYEHSDLKPNINTAFAYDAVTNGPLASASVTPGESTSHGTNVAGVIASVANNGMCTAGASYNANVLPINVFKSNGQAEYSTVLSALYYVERLARNNQVPNIKVLNMSFGAYAEDTIAVAMRNTLQRLRDSYNILPVAAGGNGDRYYRPIVSMSYPADYDVCVSVTSLTANGANSTWCDFNEYKDISAPGESILTTSNSSADKGVASVSGTSFSSPIVASAAALLYAARPSLTATQVENALKQTATRVTGNVRSQSGSKGALNVNAAVNLVLSGQSISNTPMARYNVMYRLYNPNSGEHFYTASAGERNSLVSVGWRYEGTGWNAPLAGDPVYRLYNANAGDHHYTPSAGERDMLVRAGWRYEGIGWNTSIAETKPLYRVYNPNAVAGSHHYTLSREEAIHLTWVGWRYEGIGWYGTD